MNYTLVSTETFNRWFSTIKDKTTKRKILARLARTENGHFGDYKQIYPNLYELRLFFDGGLRIYYTIRNNQIVLLLVGGDKSTQKSDVVKAKHLLEELE